MNMESTKSNYLLVRRAQASITSYCHFGKKHLSTYLDRPAFQELAQELAQKYFHKSISNAVFPEIVDVYAAYLVISSLLQRLPLSVRRPMSAPMIQLPIEMQSAIKMRIEIHPGNALNKESTKGPRMASSTMPPIPGCEWPGQRTTRTSSDCLEP